MTWYKKMIKLMKNSGKTTSQIAEGTGIPYMTVKNILTGKTKDPKLTVVLRIIEFCDGEIDEIFSEDEKEETDEDSEIREFTEEFLKLDKSGKDLVMTVIMHERERILADTEYKPAREYAFSEILYDIPVSAGTGEALDESTAVIAMLSDEPPRGTDYLLRISGNSMEPEFHDGDYVYVARERRPEYGEIGIFMYRGSVYMKKYTRDGLKSLNPAYKTIPGNPEIFCLGIVLGKVSGLVKKT